VNPLVTIAVPTYNRPDLLERALQCVARQDYANLEVLVADNASSGPTTQKVVESFRQRIPGLRYIRHEQNIGSLKNFHFLLSEARGDFFMWLADDDEISANYVSSLVPMLQANPDAASATGHWMLMSSERQGRLMPTSSFPQRAALSRIVRFVWYSDDAFFYALHRTSWLRDAHFPGYAWPNRNEVLNWAYVYLFDMVLRGPILLPADTSVQFINHDYTAKSYARRRSRLAAAMMTLLRKFNVHYLYWVKTAHRLGGLSVPVVVAVSFAALFRDIGRGATRPLLPARYR
jgi:glycosyltransferase involved in cell wall biosynthesis